MLSSIFNREAVKAGKGRWTIETETSCTKRRTGCAPLTSLHIIIRDQRVAESNEKKLISFHGFWTKIQLSNFTDPIWLSGSALIANCHWQLKTLNAISALQKLGKMFVPHQSEYRSFNPFHKYLQIPTMSLAYFAELHIKQQNIYNVTLLLIKQILMNWETAI